MKERFFPAWSYFLYWLRKEDQYSIQSPFVFDLYNGLFSYIQQHKKSFMECEAFRKSLLKNKNKIKIEDFGAGSKRLKKPIRKVSSIAKYSSTDRKFSLFYQYFCMQTPAKVVLELGTCLGINTRYLAEVCRGELHSFEGSKSLWEIARQDGPRNTTFHLGKLEDVLPDFLKENPRVDFVFIDATHNYEGTIGYFEQLLPCMGPKSIMIVADIHWSKEMEAAWEKIITHPNVQISVDFYECGVLIFDQKRTKDHFVLHY